MVCACIAWAGAGDLDKFVSLVGSFACIPLVFLYPVSLACYCKILSANSSTAYAPLQGRRTDYYCTYLGRPHVRRRNGRHGLHYISDHPELG